MVFNWAMDPSIVKREGDGSLVRIGAIALSDNFNKIAQTIGSNDFKTISDILVATKSGNNESLINAGINPIVWDVWGKQLQDFLYKKYTAKELTTLDQFKVMWMNISSGLAAVQ
jgi:CRISPR/Cas system endoribonuclease Cas6 (RAMP superfamily)